MLDQGIETGADGVLPILRRQVDVHARRLEHIVGPVDPLTAAEHVVAGAAEQVVVAVLAKEDVRAGAAEHLIRPEPAVQPIVAGIADQPVVVLRADQALDAQQQINAAADGVLDAVLAQIDQNTGELVGIAGDVVAVAADDGSRRRRRR